VTLEGDLSLRHVEPVRGRLLEALSRHDAVTVDCQAVTGADLGLIQLLIAAQKSAQVAAKTLTLAQPVSGALREALARGGFLAATSGQSSFWLKGGATP
jgi:ABC-type transporter Mla MlaB component